MKAQNDEDKPSSNNAQQSDIFSSADSKRRYNRTLFSTVAPRYSTATRVLSFGRDQSWKRELVHECVSRCEADAPSAGADAGVDASAGAGIRILDLACGTGDLTLALAERFPRAEILGVDLNPEMLAEARQRLASFLENRAPGDSRAPSHEVSGAPQSSAAVQFMEADMASLPFEDQQFSLVTAGYALRNAPDLEQTLGEISRVMRPGGLLAILEFSRSPTPALSWASVALLRFWGSLWGIVLHRDASVYGYIARSLAHYPHRAQFDQTLKRYGFSSPDRRLRMFGLLELCFVRVLPE